MKNNTTIFSLLYETCKATPHKVALYFQSEAYSYQELMDGIEQAIQVILAYDLPKKSRVAFLFKNSPQLIYYYFACFRLQVTAVPINARYQHSELEHLLIDSQPDLFIYEKSFRSLSLAAQKNTAVPFTVEMDGQAPKSSEVLKFPLTLHECSEKDAPAILFYTSGSTAKAKGAVHTHQSLFQNTLNHIECVSYDANESNLVCLPLCISFSFCHQVLTTFATGGSIYLMERFEPEAAVNLLLNNPITKLYAPPIVYTKMLNVIEKRNEPIVHSLKTAIVAGDIVKPELHSKFKTIFSLALCEGIGMSETLFYALNLHPTSGKEGSLGTATLGVQLKIVDDSHQTLPIGETGEIVIHTPTRMQRYWNNPEETQKTLINDWIHSGDLGCLDEEGYLWFKGRKKQLIVRGGMNISPLEVEQALYKSGWVDEGVVVGVPDPTWGEISVACIVLKPHAKDISEKMLLAELKKDIADYKIPDRIICMDSLPKASTDKIDRITLKRLATETLSL